MSTTLVNPARRRVVITGIGGQDGAYLAAQLLARGENVLGTRRPAAAAPPPWRLRELGIAADPGLELRALDIENAADCRALLGVARPSVLFHFAAQSGVAEAQRDPQASLRANALGTLNLLEALRSESPATRFVLASTAELFGDAAAGPQNESAPFAPRHPYALSKHYAHAMTQYYRAHHGLHASCAILFNHESPLRDPAFVTRKIAAAAARLARERGEPLALGNLDARRDFGYAPEYVAAMAAMAAQDVPDDYVLATGVPTSIREFAGAAFAAAGLAVDWRDSGVAEHAVAASDGRRLVEVDRSLFRPADAPLLLGDARKARERLGFAPRTTAVQLAELMVAAELRRLA